MLWREFLSLELPLVLVAFQLAVSSYGQAILQWEASLVEEFPVANSYSRLCEE
jgi:hypothetical protein